MFRGLNVKKIVVDRNGFNIPRLYGTFYSTRGLESFPQIDLSTVTDSNLAFYQARFNIPDPENYVCPMVYSMPLCKTLSAFFSETEWGSEYATSNAYPNFINTDSLESVHQMFQGARIKGEFNKHITNRKVVYSNFISGCSQITSINNSVKFNVYKDMTNFIGTTSLSSSFSLDCSGYDNPIDIYMKNSPGDTNL